MKIKLLKFRGTVLWSLVRHKYLLLAFSLAQAVFAVSILYGMALFLPEVDEMSAVYLSSGGLTLGIVAVGCVLAPQIVSGAKQNGIFEYQRTLPVSRSAILLADIIIWEAVSVPSVIIGCVAAMLRFGLSFHFTLQAFFIILLSQLTTICLGFCAAYWFPPNMVALVTQIIMIGGLLFSPILYPAERLPKWTMPLYQVLPFVPISRLLRSALFTMERIAILDLCVVIIWMIVTFGLSLWALSRRE